MKFLVISWNNADKEKYMLDKAFNLLTNSIHNSSTSQDSTPVKEEIAKGTTFTARQVTTLMFMLNSNERESILDQLTIEDPENLKENFKPFNLSEECRGKYCNTQVEYW